MIGFHDDANTYPCESCNGDGRFELWINNESLGVRIGLTDGLTKVPLCKACALKLAEAIVGVFAISIVP